MARPVAAGVVVKALTLHQPWASLVALGVKSIETRSWSTPYRGRLLVHAGATMTRAQRSIAYADPIGGALNAAGVMLGGDCAALPRGAVVASCTLADVVRVEAHVGGPNPQRMYLQRDRHRIYLYGSHPEQGRGGGDEITYQLPYGDFTVGRFAWLLEDVKPTTERCPACWRELRDDGMVQVDPTHLIPVRYVDARGEACDLCASSTRPVDPVPARGRQRLWNWSP